MKNQVPNEKNKMNKKRMLIETITICAPMLFLFLVNLFFIGINYNYWFILVTEKGAIIELIILYTYSFIINAITGKWKTTITVLGIALLIISLLNQLKYSFMSEPIVLSDIFFLKNSREIMGFVEGEVWNNIKTFLLPAIIEIILFIILIIVGRKISEEIEIFNKERIVYAVIGVFAFIILFVPIPTVSHAIDNAIYNVDGRYDLNWFVSDGYYHLSFGLLGGIYGHYLEDRIVEPENYDEEAVDKVLAQAEDNNEKKFGTPNIIVVFSESFWDIDQLEEIEFNVPITPNFNELKKKGLFFNMISPTYGGISANAEYEFLTGSNLMFFNLGYVPYMQLYRGDKSYNKPSIIKELKNNGYKTRMVTYTSNELFNCSNVYRYFQIDDVEYNTEIDEQYKKGNDVSDEYVTDKIIDTFNQKEKDEKLFYMVLTLESHMPYPKDKYTDYDVWITKSDFDDDINETLTTYAQGIYNADKQLERLYEYIQTFDEPTIIVFFGDHLPYWGSDKTNAIDELGFFNTSDEKLNTFRKYNTQSLIVSNFEMDLETDGISYLGPDLLGTYVINNMDINISNYYKWLYQTRFSIGAGNHYIMVDKNGNLYKPNELDGDKRELYNLRRNIEYKLFVK